MEDSGARYSTVKQNAQVLQGNSDYLGYAWADFEDVQVLQQDLESHISKISKSDAQPWPKAKAMLFVYSIASAKIKKCQEDGAQGIQLPGPLAELSQNWNSVLNDMILSFEKGGEFPAIPSEVSDNMSRTLDAHESYVARSIFLELALVMGLGRAKVTEAFRLSQDFDSLIMAVLEVLKKETEWSCSFNYTLEEGEIEVNVVGGPDKCERAITILLTIINYGYDLTEVFGEQRDGEEEAQSAFSKMEGIPALKSLVDILKKPLPQRVNPVLQQDNHLSFLVGTPLTVISLLGAVGSAAYVALHFRACSSHMQWLKLGAAATVCALSVAHLTGVASALLPKSSERDTGYSD